MVLNIFLTDSENIYVFMTGGLTNVLPCTNKTVSMQQCIRLYDSTTLIELTASLFLQKHQADVIHIVSVNVNQRT